MPWKFRERPEEKTWTGHPLVRIVLALLVCCILAAIPYGWIRYRRRSEMRQLGRAEQALARQDFRLALLEARGALEKNPNSGIAKELIAQADRALKAPDAMTWRGLSSAVESGDTDHLLGLAEAFIKAGDFATAGRALEKIKAEDRNTPRFHNLAAQFAAGSGDTAEAEKQWAEAIRLAPEVNDYRLRLAASRLASDQAEARAGAFKVIDQIKATSDGHLPALRILLADAKRHADKATAREIAAEMAADPSAEFSDKLALLSALRALRPKRDEEFAAYLKTLQESASVIPQDIFALMSWMIDNDLALMVPEWEGQLPPEIAAVPPVAPAIAQAFVRATDWKRLNEHTATAAWGDFEFLRLSFQSLALDRLGDAKAAEAAWNDAFTTAQVSPERLERLARICVLWSWKERAEEALWKLAPSEWCPRWAMDYLWNAALARGDTEKLYEISTLRLKMQPDNFNTRNNQLTLGLLAGQGGDSIHQLAADFFKDNRHNVNAAATAALSLFQQGQPKEAADLLGAFPPEDLHLAANALYYGVFLAAAGQTAPAEEYLRLAADAPQVPEEKTMLRFANALCRVHSLAEKGDNAGADDAWNEALNVAEGSRNLLEILVHRATDWKWQPRAEAALWKLSTEDGCPRWAIDALWSAALEHGNSAQRYKASKLLVKADPKDLNARNVSLLLGMLTGQEADAPRREAETLYRANVGDAGTVITYGLALYLQGRGDEALRLAAALPPEKLREPRAARYYGLFLKFFGDPDQATEFLRLGNNEPILPEEQAFIAKEIRGNNPPKPPAEPPK